MALQLHNEHGLPEAAVLCGLPSFLVNTTQLDAIRIPFLALNSDDDPIAQCAPEDYDRNEWFTLVVTRGGGHMSLSWLDKYA